MRRLRTIRACFWLAAFGCAALSVTWVTSYWTYIWAVPAGAGGNYGVYAARGALHYTGLRAQILPRGWPVLGMGSAPPLCAGPWH
jgi:hypothetical protein